MAQSLPENANEVVLRSKTDVQRSLPNSNPNLPNGWLAALITADGNRNFDWYFALAQAELNNFPGTAIGAAGSAWASFYGLTLNSGTVSSGKVSGIGSIDGNGPAVSAIMTLSDGSEYVIQSVVVLADVVLSISSLTRSGTTVTATTASNHDLSSLNLVTIAGANETEYNVTDSVINVTGADEFTYEIVGVPATPATGTITATINKWSADVLSSVEGKDSNLDSGTVLTLATPVSGIDSDAQLTFEGATGGADQELESSLQSRLISRVQNPVSHFNESDIIELALTQTGVTRVFVDSATPVAGQVTITFMNDNNLVTIPSATDVVAMKFLLSTIKPAGMSATDLIILAPVADPQTFTFTSLTPNTESMQNAVNANLDQFFAEIDVGEDMLEVGYSSAIFNTVDPDTGDKVTAFALSAPSGDVVISSTDIATKGTVTFP